MASKGGLAKWQACYSLAERRLPDTTWRQSLAKQLREAAGVDFCAVHTSPEDRPDELTHASWPESYHPVMDGVRERFLPRIEACGEGMAFALPRFGRVYAPIEVSRQRALVDDMRGYLADADVQGYIVAFIGDGGRRNDGVIVLGDRQRATPLLEQTGPALVGITTLALHASRARHRDVGLAGASPRALVKLTTRERQIADLLASGHANINVAANLGISEQTVAVHVRTIYRKLGVHTRVDLVNRLHAR